jgi:hypothetical protein
VTIDISEVGELLENKVRDEMKEALMDYMDALPSTHARTTMLAAHKVCR